LILQIHCLTKTFPYTKTFLEGLVRNERPRKETLMNFKNRQKRKRMTGNLRKGLALSYAIDRRFIGTHKDTTTNQATKEVLSF
jgi:hypothetical protein